MCDKCPNTKVFQVRIFPYLDWKWRFTTEFFLVRILLYSNQKNLIKRNVVFGYILMYGDALPIIENKFSKILIFLLIIFVFCQNRVSCSDLLSFILQFWTPTQQEVYSFTVLSSTAQLFLVVFAWSQLVIMKGKPYFLDKSNFVNFLSLMWNDFFCLSSIFGFNRAQELLWYTWSYGKFRTETPWRSKSAPKYRSSLSYMFCKVDVLKNFRKVHRKTPEPESFNK